MYFTFNSKLVNSIFLTLLMCSCLNKNSLQDKQLQDYLKVKNKFNKSIINHFPDKFHSDNRLIVNTKNIEKNNIFIMLCEYDVDKKIISEIKKHLLGSSRFSVYSPKDSCLLIINRFETFETSDNLDVVTDIDTSKVNKPCYNTLKPIPNFIDIENPVKNSEIKLNDTYAIYVLESNSEKKFPEYNLKPSPQMPKNWKNGYSKGVAISEKEKTVIYWGIIW